MYSSGTPLRSISFLWCLLNTSLWVKYVHTGRHSKEEKTWKTKAHVVCRVSDDAVSSSDHIVSSGRITREW
jgi:hypothetical protein